MRRVRIMGISGYANGCAHIQIQAFFAAESTGTQSVAQTFRDHERLILAGLRQQHDELIATIAEREIDQSQLRLDQISDLGQQLASYQMPVRVVHGLEVIEI